MVVALVAALVVPMAALADNQGEQQASTGYATTINIVDKEGDNAITTIIFPEGSPSAIISTPYNNFNTVSDPQVLSATVSEPVVRLSNTSGGTLTVWLEITAWTNSVVASERYELASSGATNINAVASVLSANGGAASISTGISMDAATYRDLYLEVTLSALAGKSGISTLTILGET